MAVFQYNNRSISYHLELAPFAADLILLQGSRFDASYWRPVLDELVGGAPAGGRIMTCEWSNEGENRIQPEDFVRLVQTLGLQKVHLVACEDAVELIAGVQRLEPAIFEKTLFYPTQVPKGEDLKRAVRVFCPA
ncbi:MAG: hypothetical protein KF799_14980 [Bdellovibrionales bacterium]|nr:hypothetical protein [Bdellovibrionales bacterium]